MSVTVRENIFANIKTALLVMSVTNGYANDFKSIQRWKQQGNRLKDCPCVVIKSGPEAKKDNQTCSLKFCTLSVLLDLWVREAESSTVDSEIVINSLLGDIEKALMADITRGGYARDTKLVSSVPFETVEGEPMHGLAIELEVIYAHKQNDPYTQG